MGGLQGEAWQLTDARKAVASHSHSKTTSGCRQSVEAAPVIFLAIEKGV
jgi:hypothetical protein